MHSVDSDDMCDWLTDGRTDREEKEDVEEGEESDNNKCLVFLESLRCFLPSVLSSLLFLKMRNG